jgi:hypothetical protein
MKIKQIVLITYAEKFWKQERSFEYLVKKISLSCLKLNVAFYSIFKTFSNCLIGRCQARNFCSQRKALLASSHFIQSYLESFVNDPCCKAADKLNDDDDTPKR